MNSRQLTVNGPETSMVVFSKRTRALDNHVPFELPGGRWGVKLGTGALVFSGGGPLQSCAATYKQLRDRNDLRLCRVLPGQVEITYKPIDSTMHVGEIAPADRRMTLEEIEALVQNHVDAMKQRGMYKEDLTELVARNCIERFDQHRRCRA